MTVPWVDGIACEFYGRLRSGDSRYVEHTAGRIRCNDIRPPPRGDEFARSGSASLPNDRDVFTAISTVTGGDVTASYDNVADKVTLTSAGGSVMHGAANDTTNFLRALKLGNNGTGSVTSSAQLGAVKLNSTIANANLTTAVPGDVTGAGNFTVNSVQIDYNVNTDTASVISQINDSTAGVVASYDARSPSRKELRARVAASGGLGRLYVVERPHQP